jgi:plastocyanin
MLKRRRRRSSGAVAGKDLHRAVSLQPTTPTNGGSDVRFQAAGHATKRSLFSISALALAAALLALAGCGSSSSSSSSASTAAEAPTTSSAAAPTTSPAKSATPAPAGAAEKVSLEANSEGQLAYNTKSLSAKAGKVSVDFTNSSPLPHNVTIESSSGQQVGATPTFAGGSKSLSVTLKAGTYKFFCSVPGHRQAGMEGTLTVK